MENWMWNSTDGMRNVFSSMAKLSGLFFGVAFQQQDKSKISILCWIFPSILFFHPSAAICTHSVLICAWFIVIRLTCERFSFFDRSINGQNFCIWKAFQSVLNHLQNPILAPCIFAWDFCFAGHQILGHLYYGSAINFVSPPLRVLAHIYNCWFSWENGGATKRILGGLIYIQAFNHHENWIWKWAKHASLINCDSIEESWFLGCFQFMQKIKHLLLKVVWTSQNITIRWPLSSSHSRSLLLLCSFQLIRFQSFFLAPLL